MDERVVLIAYGQSFLLPGYAAAWRLASNNDHHQLARAQAGEEDFAPSRFSLLLSPQDGKRRSAHTVSETTNGGRFAKNMLAKIPLATPGRAEVDKATSLPIKLRRWPSVV